jgi:DNA-binding GntR family transcriptional regulator
MLVALSPAKGSSVATTALTATSPVIGVDAAPRAPQLTQSLPEQIAARLSERIVAGEYFPGQRILEQAVSAEFGVSRGPVREALRLLEKDGLVTILARRGAQVTALTVEEVREIFDIRAVLNGLRDRLLAEDAQRARVLEVLEAEVGQLARLARDPAAGEAYVETVFRLNGFLNEAVGNRRLRAILASLSLQTLRYSRLGLSTPERRRQSVRHWQRLVKAIRAGDGAEAQRIAERRVLDSRDAAIKALEKGAPLAAAAPHPASRRGKSFAQPSSTATT